MNNVQVLFDNLLGETDADRMAILGQVYPLNYSYSLSYYVRISIYKIKSVNL